MTQNMRVIIVGSGLVGLSAAVCFARRGHQVLVLDRREQLSPEGGGIAIRPGASQILHSWGLREDLEAVSSETPSALLRSTATGKVLQRNVLLDVSKHPEWGTTRRHLMDLLYKAAIKAGATIHFGRTVVGIAENSTQAVVKLRNGEQHAADLVIAADGVRSKIRRMILSDFPEARTEPRVSDMALYIVKLKGETFMHHPDSRLLANADQTNINVWLGPDKYGVSHWHPQLSEFQISYGIRSPPEDTPLWEEHGDIEFVRKHYAGTCRELTLPLEVAHSCERWRLSEVPDLPRWISAEGRVLLMGDAAHGMLPSAAQAYSLGVEDIGVLEYLLHRNTSRQGWSQDDMRNTAGTWQTLRKGRVEKIKDYARWNLQVSTGDVASPMTGNKQEKVNIKSAKDIKPEMNAKFHSAQFVKWALDFDAVADAKRHVEGLKACL